MKDVAKECEKYGVQTLVVETDVTDADSVFELARKASKAFNGRIDVWVNDAGVGAIGHYEIVPIDSHVIAVNLMGYMNGAHAVLPYFKKLASRNNDQHELIGCLYTYCLFSFIHGQQIWFKRFYGCYPS